MNEKVKKTLSDPWFVILVLLSFIWVGLTIWSSGRLRSTRAELDSVRLELESATELSDQLSREVADSRAESESLRRTINECNELVKNIEQASNNSISTVRECIELVRAIREKVTLLADYLSSVGCVDVSSNSDSNTIED